MEWHSWGEEAFTKARVEDRPIFLSIGYSTCHWCHVMERESFSNKDVAEFLNRHFVCVKVNRDELPHVDHMYMDFATALLGGGGGWPLNLFLTPELKPFYAVTYVPPTSREGMMGIRELGEHVSSMWNGEDRNQLIEQGDRVVEVFAENEVHGGWTIPDANDLDTMAANFFEDADPVFGGLKNVPKFPLSYQLLFLMEYAKSHEDSRAAYFVRLTLDKMIQGGLYDQIGGGFARYAVDVKWQIPHFEKMLYDNALLANTYLEAHRFFKVDTYREIAEETLKYVDRELSHPDGGFYAGEDAETEGEEGLFYTWSKSEIEEAFSPEEAAKVLAAFHITEGGNFEGRTVPVRGTDAGLWKKRLFELREKRKKPNKDKKILTSWNGLMIEAFARAGDRRRAEKALAFIEQKMAIGGKLFHCFFDGDVRHDGVLEDYAFLIRAYLAMQDKYLEKAIEWTEVVEKYFKIPGGAYYSVEEDGLPFFRKCDLIDGSEPSGNSVHLENLLRIYEITGEREFLDRAEQVLKAARDKMLHSPTTSGYFALALGRYLQYNRTHERNIRRFSNSP